MTPRAPPFGGSVPGSRAFSEGLFSRAGAGKGAGNVRNHRIRRAERVQAAAPPGSRAARVSRLRLRRDRPARGRRPRLRPRRREPPEPEGGRRSERLARDARARPYALGHARLGDRAERPSARRLRRREALDRPERDRRELPRAPGAPPGGGSRVHLRDGRGVRLSPDRAPLRRRPRRRRPQGLRRARGALRVRRDPPRPPRPARRHAPALPARRRRGRGGDVPRVQRGRLPARDPHGLLPERSRGRRDHAGRRHLHRPQTGVRSSTTRSCSTGTTRAPRRAATRPSC